MQPRRDAYLKTAMLETPSRQAYPDRLGWMGVARGLELREVSRQWAAQVGEDKPYSGG